MSQTLLAVQAPGIAGAAPTYNAVDATNGNTFKNDGATLALIKNGGGASITVTFASVPDPFGRTGDVVVTVPAAGEIAVGPFDPRLFNQADANAGDVNVAFSAGTSVTMALLGA